MFLSDKYSVKNLDDVLFNTDVYNSYFQHLVSNLQNIILCGYDCSGKKTFLNLILNAIYGDTSLKEIEYTINNYGSNLVKIKLQQSKYHIILNTNNSAIDKYIIQEVLVEFCKKNDLYYSKKTVPYKCIVVLKADLLSQSAQFALRRLVEEYSLCRFIIVCKNVCSMIEPIRQRFLEINFSCPTNKELKQIVTTVCEKENINCSEGDITSMIRHCDRNLKQTFVLLDAKTLALDFKCLWKEVLEKVFELLKSNVVSSFNKVTELKNCLGQIFITNIESEYILTFLEKKIIEEVHDQKKLIEILEILVKYDTRLKNATRYILHLEGMIYNINNILHSKS